MSTGINDPNRCQWCGMFHPAKCHLVKKITYRDDGGVQCVEFFAPNDYAPMTSVAPVTVPYGQANTRARS